MNNRLVDPERVNAWMTEARKHAKLASLIVNHLDDEFSTNAIVEVQQASEFTAKGLMLAHGLSHADVTRMGHETMAVFLKLVVSVVADIPNLSLWSERPMLDSAKYGPVIIKKLDLYRRGGKRAREERRKLLFQWNRHFPKQDFLQGEEPEIDSWNREVRAWPAHIIEAFLDVPDTLHDEAQGKFGDMIPEDLVIRPQSLLAGMGLSHFVYEKIISHVDSRFHSYDRFINSNRSIRWLDSAAQHWLRDHLSAESATAPLNVREMVTSQLLLARAFIRLFIIGTIAAPHYLSARYPTEYPDPELDMEPLMYTDDVGVVRCLPRLAEEVANAIDVLSDG